VVFGASCALALISAACVATAPAADAPGAVLVVPVTPTTTALPREVVPTPIVATRHEGMPWGDTVAGLLTFRGNPTRTWYGAGPLPAMPSVQWRFPERAMCSLSTDPEGEREWCGTGWTGQPAVFERDDRTWLVFGAYDRAIHFLDAVTGERLLPDVPTGDIVKGSVTVDPDGFPLVYSGSRDGRYRVIAIDGGEARVLWELSASAVRPTLWNDDWDGAGLVIDDYLIEGGENSQLHVVRLNRGYDADGRVTVAPQLAWNTPGWDSDLLHDLGDTNVSIESSVVYLNGVVWFTNSGGLVQGWRIGSPPMSVRPERVFRYWVGDDTDATLVAGDDGDLYVAAEWDRGTARAAEVGQLLRLDPSTPDDPVVWSFADQGEREEHGFWATPALVGDLVIAPTTGGRLLGLDRATGSLRWEKELLGPVWQSPVVVDGVLLEGDCRGDLHAYDLRDPMVEPPELWSVHLGGCIESTPAVWGGRIHVGTRAGQLVTLG
jgi:outer membrane protein assembly factor BamB